jgi:hypothetical protein
VDENALYRLEPILDNPKYEGFGFVRQESLRGQRSLLSDFMPDDMLTKGRKWTVTPLAPFWTPQQVIGRVRSFNDYPAVGMCIPAFSRRAVDVLREFLEPNGELLPLVSAVGEYLAYNPTKVADVLDEAKSQIRWLSDKHTFDQIFEIDRYECFADRMAGLSIFRLVERSSKVFVTQVFVDRVRQHQLQGFHFIKLWPLPAGVSWREEDEKERKKKVRVKTKRGAMPDKGNTVVLRFPIAKGKPSKSEKDRLAELMDEVDALLYDPAAKPSTPIAGTLEGDDVVEGELRLFLSCQDADVLVDKLRPWLTNLSWARDVKVLKRYGELADANCPEEYVELKREKEPG